MKGTAMTIFDLYLLKALTEWWLLLATGYLAWHLYDQWTKSDQ
ncbi:hypothetical protein GCM10027517_11730 [Phycicoccus ginsengisoli]